jgi:tripartite-type tricarboxylate transporter receptor subunit TctC
VAATTPSAVIPDVLPFPAQGLPDVIISTWEGAFAPSGTPQPVLDKVRDSLKELFADAEVREKVAATGLDLIWMDTPAFTEAIRSDLEKWTRVVQKTRKTQ